MAFSSATQQTIAWTMIFFFASAAAGAAYLTVSETFPIEIRALAIAIFYAAGTAIGGVAAPYLFGGLIATGSRASVFVGYLLGAGADALAAVVAADLGRRRRAQAARGRGSAFVVCGRLNRQPGSTSFNRRVSRQSFGACPFDKAHDHGNFSTSS